MKNTENKSSRSKVPFLYTMKLTEQRLMDNLGTPCRAAYLALREAGMEASINEDWQVRIEIKGDVYEAEAKCSAIILEAAEANEEFEGEISAYAINRTQLTIG